MKNYTLEKVGQEEFFKNYKITFENNYGEEIIVDSTDGIFRGSLFEFKLNINDLNKCLFQAIKYLSKERIKGHNVPASIFLVDLNKEIVYEYKSVDYYKEIHVVYYGGASKENNGFTSQSPFKIYNLEKLEDDNLFRQSLEKNTDFLKIDIDENCVIGWAKRYYKMFPSATKDDLLSDTGEFRKPNIFKDYINPYIGETNKEFRYLMDVLNDRMKKKELGAFYSPATYCKKATELIRDAIKRVPEGNDYIILDRCAGTGNLEMFLSEEELSHCILSTIEYYEYQVLNELYSGRVRAILPVDDNGNSKDITIDDKGMINGLDALSKEFLETTYVKKFIDSKTTTIIVLENPPYQESGGVTGETVIEKSYIDGEMKKKIKKCGMYTREKANRFIWSAFEYYLREDTDSLILFSPIKYWKSANVINKEFLKGFVFNKEYFHASKSALCCILWSNKDSKIDCLKDLSIFDITDYDKETEAILDTNKKIDIKRMVGPSSDLIYEKNNKVEVFDFECKSNGDLEKLSDITGTDRLGYLATKSYESVFNNFWFGSSIYKGIHSGVYLRRDDYLNKLPVGAAKLFDRNTDIWWSNLFYNTSDGGTKYQNDYEFLKSSLIYMCLTPFNRCRSLKGKNKIYYNELCFDTKSKYKSQALKDLHSITLDNDGNQRIMDPKISKMLLNEDTNTLKFKPFELNSDEKELFKLWEKVLNEAVLTKNYNKDFSYGLDQIEKELNTSKKVKDKIQYDYPLLNGNINTLKTKLKEYYKKYIEPKCFEYELLK